MADDSVSYTITSSPTCHQIYLQRKITHHCTYFIVGLFLMFESALGLGVAYRRKISHHCTTTHVYRNRDIRGVCLQSKSHHCITIVIGLFGGIACRGRGRSLITEHMCIFLKREISHHCTYVHVSQNMTPATQKASMEEAAPMEFASLLTNNRDQMVMTQLREIQLMMIQLQRGYHKLQDAIQDVLDTVTNRGGVQKRKAYRKGSPPRPFKRKLLQVRNRKPAPTCGGVKWHSSDDDDDDDE